MLNFFKSFSSNIHYNYSVQSRPSFVAGCWSVFDAKSKTSSEPVSVFVLDKKSASEALSANGIKPRSASLAEVWEFAKRGVEQLTKLRHPAILRLVEPLESSKGSLQFVTERVTGTIASSGNAELDELAIVRGLTTVVQALSFLHDSLGISHLNLTPQTVFMDAQGDWKLAGFEFAVNFEEYANSEYFLPQLDPRMPQYMQPAYDYLAPELVISKTLCAANDVWSLACLIYTLFQRKPPMRTRNNSSAYKEELKHLMKQIGHASTMSKFPKSLQPYLGALFCEDPHGRLGLSALETTDFFQNPLIKALKSIDEFAAKPVDEKVAFLKHFEQLLPQFPKQMRIRKILKFATAELSGPRDPATATLVGNVLFAVCTDMSRLTFQEQVLPLFAKLHDYLQFQESVANNLETIAKATSDKDFSKAILPLITECLKHHDAQYAPIQTRMLASSSVYKDNLTIPKLEQSLFPAVIECFAATPARSVKVAATECLGVLVERGVSKALIADSMIPALERMKTRDPAVALAVSRLWESIASKLSTQQVFEQAVPHLLQLSLSNQLTVPQFKSITAIIRREIDSVEKSQIKVLAHNNAQADEDDWLSSPTAENRAQLPPKSVKPAVAPKTIPGPMDSETDFFGTPVGVGATVPHSKAVAPVAAPVALPPKSRVNTTINSQQKSVPLGQPEAKAAGHAPVTQGALAIPSIPMNTMRPTARSPVMSTTTNVRNTNASGTGSVPGMMAPLMPTSMTTAKKPTSQSPASESLPSLTPMKAMTPMNTKSLQPSAESMDDSFGSFMSSSNGGSLI